MLRAGKPTNQDRYLHFSVPGVSQHQKHSKCLAQVSPPPGSLAPALPLTTSQLRPRSAGQLFASPAEGKHHKVTASGPVQPSTNSPSIGFVSPGPNQHGLQAEGDKGAGYHFCSELGKRPSSLHPSTGVRANWVSFTLESWMPVLVGCDLQLGSGAQWLTLW